jgi:hypothetical protein
VLQTLPLGADIREVVVGVATQPLIGGVALAGGSPASRVLCLAILCKNTPDRSPTELHLRTNERWPGS